MSDPDWLVWTRELQSIAQAGLTYSEGPFDRERYTALRALASKMMASQTAASAEQVAALFAGELGYTTPKVDVRGAVFDDQQRVLLVRETLDEGRWSLPGGWADVNLTPAENVVKEVREESGYDVRVRKLAAVWDRDRSGYPPAVFSCCKFYFVCDLVGGTPATSHETSEAKWFAENELPADFSLPRVLLKHVARMFAHARDPMLPTEFD